MKKIIIAGALSTVGLGTLVSLGDQQDFVSRMIQVSGLGGTFGLSEPSAPATLAGVPQTASDRTGEKKSRLPFAVADRPEPTQPIPDYVLWRVILSFPERLAAAAEKARAAGESDLLFTEYFTRQAKLSPGNAEILKQAASQYAIELKPLSDRATTISSYRKSVRNEGKRLLDKEKFSLSKEQFDLQEKQKKLAIRYKEKIRSSIDQESFASFEQWLTTEFSRSFQSGTINPKDSPKPKNSPESKSSPFPLNDGFETLPVPQKEVQKR